MPVTTGIRPALLKQIASRLITNGIKPCPYSYACFVREIRWPMLNGNVKFLTQSGNKSLPSFQQTLVQHGIAELRRGELENAADQRW